MAAPHGDEQLLEQKTVEELEKEFTLQLDQLSAADRADPARREALLKPFGFKHADWLRFKAALRPGDEIWTYRSSPESWQALAGRAGIVIYRNGKPLRRLLTAMN